MWSHSQWTTIIQRIGKSNYQIAKSELYKWQWSVLHETTNDGTFVYSLWGWDDREDMKLPVVVPAQALKGGEVVSEPLEIIGLHLGGKSLAQDLWPACNITRWLTSHYHKSSSLKYYTAANEADKGYIGSPPELVFPCKQLTKSELPKSLSRHTSRNLQMLCWKRSAPSSTSQCISYGLRSNGLREQAD